DEDVSATFMDAVRDFTPTGHLLLRVNAGRVLVALTLLRDLARFGDQQSSGCALAVIFDSERVRHKSCDGAISRQGCHNSAIFQRNRAELIGVKKFGGHLDDPMSGLNANASI